MRVVKVVEAEVRKKMHAKESSKATATPLVIVRQIKCSYTTDTQNHESLLY